MTDRLTAAEQAARIIAEWGDAVAAIQSAPGAPDYVDVGRAIAMGDLMADALRAALAAPPPDAGLVALVRRAIEKRQRYRALPDGDSRAATVAYAEFVEAQNDILAYPLLAPPQEPTP